MKWLLPALASLTLTLPVQETGVLRVTVVLADAAGNPIPVPRLLLLVSDNPATSEPRRVRTGADGSIQLTLRAGTYTVETDQPVSLGGHAYAWTQMVDVAAGREAWLALTPTNAEIGAETSATTGPATSADAASVFSRWQRSIVELWTPTRHATGFLVDARGFIATNDRALGDAATVEVLFSPDPRPNARGALKVHGRVVATDRLQGITIIWIDPATVASLPPVPLNCEIALPQAPKPPGPQAPRTPRPQDLRTPGPRAIEYADKVVAMIAPLLEPKDALLGTVSRVTSQSFQVDWRLTADAAGGPVFTGDGHAIGVTVADEPPDPRRQSRQDDSYVIPIENACAVIAAAEKRIAGAVPPPATPLRVAAGAATPPARKPADSKAKGMQVVTLPASDFDISLLTSEMARREQATAGLRGDFGNWSEYVAKAPPQLFVRATPQFEESFWKTLARGAAQTQGVALPPMKSFNASFLRLRAFCGAAEVAPIHPLIIERQVAGGTTIREGLYVFALTDFGPQCGTVRFDVYSEKSGQKADSRAIDPSVFTLIAKES